MEQLNNTTLQLQRKRQRVQGGYTEPSLARTATTEEAVIGARSRSGPEGGLRGGMRGVGKRVLVDPSQGCPHADSSADAGMLRAPRHPLVDVARRLVHHPPVVEAEKGPAQHALLRVVQQAVVPNEALPALDVLRGVSAVEGPPAQAAKEQPCTAPLVDADGAPLQVGDGVVQGGLVPPRSDGVDAHRAAQAAHDLVVGHLRHLRQELLGVVACVQSHHGEHRREGLLLQHEGVPGALRDEHRLVLRVLGQQLGCGGGRSELLDLIRRAGVPVRGGFGALQQRADLVDVLPQLRPLLVHKHHLRRGAQSAPVEGLTGAQPLRLVP
eukprot:RCo034864